MNNFIKYLLVFSFAVSALATARDLQIGARYGGAIKPSGVTVTPVAFQSAVTSTSGSFSLNVGSGSNRLLVVWVGGSAITGVTYNGTAMTQIGSTVDGSTSMWRLVNPTSGSNTVSITGTVNVAIAAAFNNVHQTTPVANNASSVSSGSSASVAITSGTSNDMKIMASYDVLADSFTQSGGTGTQIGSTVTSASFQRMAAFRNGGASTNPAAAYSDSLSWVVIGCLLKAA